MISCTFPERHRIPDGELELVLPLVVHPHRLSINGDGPPRVTEVNTTAEDGQYSAGQQINISVTFTTPVVFDPTGRFACLSVWRQKRERCQRPFIPEHLWALSPPPLTPQQALAPAKSGSDLSPWCRKHG